MTDPLSLMGTRLQALADATEQLKGPMLLPDVKNITSRANRELKNDAAWGSSTTVDRPVHAVLTHLELLYHAANDHLRSLGVLLAGEPVSWVGQIAVARAVVETSCRLWYLSDDPIGAEERVRRHLQEIQYELAHRAGMLGGPFKSLPKTLFDAASFGDSTFCARAPRALGALGTAHREPSRRVLGVTASAGAFTTVGRRRSDALGKGRCRRRSLRVSPASVDTGGPTSVACCLDGRG